MESNVAVTPSKSKLPEENVNPNVTSPNLKPSNSPALKSAIKNKIYSPSPKNRIRERKFVVAKKNSNRDKSETLVSVNCKCTAGADSSRCVCVAYETLRASQEGFFKSQIEGSVQEEVIGNPSLSIEGEIEVTDTETETSGEKRRREKIPEPGSGRVMHLVKAFENILVLPKSGDEDDEKEKRDSKWEFSSASFEANELLLTVENLGLCSRVSSSLDGNRGSLGNRTTNGGRQSRRNSSESASTFGGGRWRRRTNRATSQQPFKLRTEQRGRSKQEEFMKKVQEMMIEEEKQRIPIAQGLPFTTDEPECLVKPPVKEVTRPIDLVLHSDVRAVERAEFDHQVQEKISFIEQYRLERERLQKLEEEEELRRLRKELVPKAQPMPYFDRPFIPRRSEKQPTIPKEPKFHNHPQHKKIKCCGSMLSWSDVCAQAQ
ncbi:microtubule-destabilizing protein 60-like [Bidens hawaiensis]|uniref:microtubule-destabilizing protein 60-like n=1 Tax=Bidens hawaiensis TaxID=980011 RepID=UPI00404A1E5B